MWLGGFFLSSHPHLDEGLGGQDLLLGVVQDRELAGGTAGMNGSSIRLFQSPPCRGPNGARGAKETKGVSEHGSDLRRPEAHSQILWQNP